MKIISLLPVKNEAWIIKAFVENMLKVVDEIIILDDNSTDDSIEIASQFDKVKIFKNNTNCNGGANFSNLRQELLRLGRQSGGTHFVWLDADEMFSANFTPIARKTILSLKIGGKIMLPWVSLWKNQSEYICNGFWKPVYKDFIVCDDGALCFQDKFIHEDRTPGPNNQIIRIPSSQGAVHHFQFIDWDRNQLKQAYYRCVELINGARSAQRINASYKSTLLDTKIIIKKLEKNAIVNNMPNIYSIVQTASDWRYDAISRFFDKFGIEYFESLQIWHIKELRDEFIRRVNRVPLSRAYPDWLLKINDVINYICNSVHNI